MKRISFLLAGLALMLFLGCENPSSSTGSDEETIEKYTNPDEKDESAPADKEVSSDKIKKQ